MKYIMDKNPHALAAALLRDSRFLPYVIENLQSPNDRVREVWRREGEGEERDVRINDCFVVLLFILSSPTTFPSSCFYFIFPSLSPLPSSDLM
jgi:hypothetical protein